ncbi:MAG: PRC-barrel domain containing protein [Sphingomonas sp.]|uniref:PRC-barrel domain containing protein n=1 Tax=Sphingomonas sp. TaxID=28214 RepID=UPI001AC8786D|nr:PRC-barrel domain containing protein [Sphingomonas sp.]MBN8808281.1 PRC-barrel domain containing protein [Sphingomonas sp.]
MIAAMMTAANLGARVTGWGFVVFTIGSLGWALVGLSWGQTNLLATNAFLTLVNLVGIWRWLGRQRGYEDGGKSAEDASRRASATPDLLAATGVVGARLKHADGAHAGKIVEALFECRSARISYVVVSRTAPGAIREDLRAVPREAIAFACDGMTLDLTPEAFAALPVLDDGDWPATPPSVRTMPTANIDPGAADRVRP